MGMILTNFPMMRGWLILIEQTGNLWPQPWRIRNLHRFVTLQIQIGSR